MSDSEKLEEYISRNAPKSTEKKLVPPPPTPKKKQLKTPLSWYRSKVIGDIVGFTVISSVVSGITAAFLFNNSYLDPQILTLISWAVWVVLMSLNVSINLYRLQRYTRWIKGELYKINGWDDFFRIRSESFWTKRNYTQLKIIIKLTPEATDLHLNAVKTFTKKTVEKWDKRYEGIEWEPGMGTPKDLVSNGTSLQGEFSRAELMQLVKILITRFLPLARLLGNKLWHVTIESNTKENHIPARKVSRGPYERQG